MRLRAALGCSILVLAFGLCACKSKPQARRAGSVAPKAVQHPSPPAHAEPPPAHPTSAGNGHEAPSANSQPGEDLGEGEGIASCSPDSPQYSQCVIHHLEGHAQSAHDLALLIESYRSIGSMPKALQHMREFVQRYPTKQRAYQYRQILEAERHRGQHPAPRVNNHAATQTASAQGTPAAPGGGSGTGACDPESAHFSQCVIHHLEGHAQSAHDLALLIESYRAAGNMPKALEHMAEFVQRYPTTQRAELYRQVLERHRDGL